MLINDQSRYCHPERNLVILSEAKDLPAQRARPFAEFPLSEAHGLRVTNEGSRKVQPCHPERNLVILRFAQDLRNEASVCPAEPDPSLRSG